MKKVCVCVCVCRMSVFVLYPVVPLLMFHPSLLSLPTNLDITFPSSFLPNFPVLKAQDMRHSARMLWSSAGQVPQHTLTLACAEDRQEGPTHR